MANILVQLVAGGVAGVSEVLTMYPTDVIKTRMQLCKISPGGGSPSISEIASSIAQNEGYRTFYRGISAPLLAEAPKRAGKFMFNEQFKKIWVQWLPPARFGPLPFVLSGVCAGSLETLMNTPFEVIKVRMQSPAGKALYTGTIQAAGKIFREEGLRGIYRGIEAQFWRNAYFNGLYFGVAPTVRSKLWKPTTKRSTLLREFVVGTICGFLGTSFATPFDMIKSRMQSVKVSATSGAVVGGTSSKFVYPALLKIAREEGPKALFRGWVMRIVRLGPGGGIMLVVFDSVYNYLAVKCGLVPPPKPKAAKV